METWRAEYTDTFGGEANYAWVKRATFKTRAGASQREVMRAAKAALNLSGVPGRTESYGDAYTFRPYGICTVLFVNHCEG